VNEPDWEGDRARNPVLLLLLILLVLQDMQGQTHSSTASETLYAEAQKALAAGRFAEAHEDYQKLSKLSPGIAEIHATLGAIEYQQKLFPEALEELNKARRLKPDLPRLSGLIAMSLSELGRFEEALPGLETTFKETADLQIKRMSGLQIERAYTGLHREADAVEVALTLQRLFPEDPEVLYHNERIFGSFAYLTVQRLVEVAPNSVWRHQAQAEALEAQGSHDASVNEYRAILATDPRRPGVHYRIGRVLRELAHDRHDPADLTAAMAEFQDELKIDPENASALYEVGELHRLAGELELARSRFAAALKIYPDFPEANLGLGTVLSDLHQPAEALVYLKRAVASDPGDEAIWYHLSQVERSLGHTAAQQQALAQFRRLHEHGLSQPLVSPRDVSRQEIEGASPE